MKAILYQFLFNIIRLTLPVYFKRIDIKGLKQLNSKLPTIFAVNHQNAFLDAVLVVIYCNRKITFLTRADIFKWPYTWFLDALNMIPIYRKRDGMNSLAGNQAVFDTCSDLLLNDEAVLIFPEAHMHDDYFLRPITKGIARLAHHAQLNNPSDIQIVPVGINYQFHSAPRSDLHINFGEAIQIGPLVRDASDGLSTAKKLRVIKDKVELAMKELLWIPQEDIHYEPKVRYLRSLYNLPSFYELKRKLEEVTTFKSQHPEFLKFVSGILTIPNLPVHLFSNWILGVLSNRFFDGSIKLLVSLIFPLWWIFLAIVTHYINPDTLVWPIVIVVAIASLFFRAETKKATDDYFSIR